MIRVSPTAVVFSRRLSGSHTIWQTLIEVDGKPVPYVVESEDPDATELLLAGRLRTILGASVAGYSPRVEQGPKPSGDAAKGFWILAIVVVLVKACL